MKWAALLSAAALVAAAPTCDDNVKLTVTASALNLIIPEKDNMTTIVNMTFAALTNFTQSLPTRNITGNYVIAGRYCTPEVRVASRASTVQLLVHGLGYTRNYWSGEGLPGSSQQVSGAKYSWVDYASRQGYPTFTIDRLCNGQSSHPVGLECQLQLNAATIHGVIKQLRAGKVGGKAFSKVIYVGHSIGSDVGNILSQNYPNDAEAYVLTGYSIRNYIGLPGTLGTYAPLPAAVISPNQYGSLDPSYEISSSRSGFEAIFYYGDYNKSLVDIDFARRGTAAFAEVATFPLGELPAPSYKGSLMVLTAQNDQVFCPTGPINAIIGVRADCGQGSNSASAEVHKIYPGVKKFVNYQTQNTGHCLNLHNTAMTTFAKAHEFMNSI